jgi:lipopolysaccharide export system permease protein
MKTIHRSIFKELLLTFVLGVFAFNFVLMTEKVLKVTKLLGSAGSSLSDMALILLYLQPKLAVLTTPLSMLLAVLVTYGRLNADNEITVMRSSGMSLRAISRPVFTLGLLCFSAGLLVSLYIAPLGSMKVRESVSGIIARRAPHAIEEGIFNTSFKDVVIFVGRKHDSGTLEGVFVYDSRNMVLPTAMYASLGRVSSAGQESLSLELMGGHIYILRGQKVTDLQFGRYHMSIPFTGQSPSRRIEELSSMELLTGAQTLAPPARDKYLIELHRRLSMPALTLILMLLGPPLALMAGKTGKLGGLAIGLLVFTGYYSFLTYGENLVISGYLPHYAGAWGPALVFGMLALWLFRREEAR